MPFSSQSATTAISATSGDVATASTSTASKQSMPPIPAEFAIDIPPSPSKQSNIPSSCLSATLDSNWIFIDIPLTPTKESPVPPPVHATKLPLLLRRFLEKTFLLILLLLAVGFLSWYIFTRREYSERDPNFQIGSASVHTSAVYNPLDHYVRADWRIGISARNPNERTPIVYRKVAVRMSHDFDEFEVSNAIAAPFQQEPGNLTTLIARSEPESKGTKLQYEILDTVLEFNVTMQVELSYKCRTCLRKSWFELEVVCPQVKVFHDTNGPRIGGPQLCSVQSKRQMN